MVFKLFDLRGSSRELISHSSPPELPPTVRYMLLETCNSAAVELLLARPARHSGVPGKHTCSFANNFATSCSYLERAMSITTSSNLIGRAILNNPIL